MATNLTTSLNIDGTTYDLGDVELQSNNDISSSYSLSKTSGAWNVGTITVRKWGHVVAINLRLLGAGTAVSAGSNGFVGVLSGPALPTVGTNLTFYYSGGLIIASLDGNGALTARVIGQGITAASGDSLALKGLFLTAS